MAKSQKPRRLRAAPPAGSRGTSDGTEVLTQQEHVELRAQIVKQIVRDFDRTFNTMQGPRHYGITVIAWDIGVKAGRLTYSSNASRTEVIQIMTQLRERFEAPAPPPEKDMEPQ